MKYIVITQLVEINGKTREIGEVLDASDFKPKPTDNSLIILPAGIASELSELESLLGTKHIEPVSEG